MRKTVGGIPIPIVAIGSLLLLVLFLRLGSSGWLFLLTLFATGGVLIGIRLLVRRLLKG